MRDYLSDYYNILKAVILNCCLTSHLFCFPYIQTHSYCRSAAPKLTDILGPGFNLDDVADIMKNLPDEAMEEVNSGAAALQQHLSAAAAANTGTLTAVTEQHGQYTSRRKSLSTSDYLVIITASDY